MRKNKLKCKLYTINIIIIDTSTDMNCLQKNNNS